MFYFMVGIAGLYIFYVLLVWPASKLCPKVAKITKKLRGFLFWNGTMRFFIESYMDIALFTMLNLKEYEWDYDFSLITASHVLAFVMVVVITLGPVALLVGFACNISKWGNERFVDRYGTFLDGADLERERGKWLVLLIPVTYFLRRLLMCATLVFWIDFIWGQLAI